MLCRLEYVGIWSAIIIAVPKLEPTKVRTRGRCILCGEDRLFTGAIKYHEWKPVKPGNQRAGWTNEFEEVAGRLIVPD